ncbi:MAG: hypothetical protein JWO38_8072 [Gemmataceae bacterium]|nr:hypothetical protein [Gemmataceae bacterium]
MNLTTRVAGRLRSALVARPGPPAAPPVPRDRRPKAAVAVAVGAAAAVVLQLALGVATELSLYLRDPGYADKELRLARQEKANPGAPAVVMLGTSRTGFAFHAGRVHEHLAPALGGPAVAFNFGIPASGPVTHLVYLRRLIADGHRPALLLVEVLPPTLADVPVGPALPAGPLEARFLFGDRLRHAEAEAVIGYGFPAAEVRKKWRGSVFTPWYTSRFPLLGRLAPSALPWHLRFDWSRSCDELGWSSPITDSVTPEEYEAALGRAAAEYKAVLADMHPTGGGAKALADLLALCREQGIPAQLVLMPESAGFRALYPPATTARLYQFLSGLCSEHGCGLIDARTWLPDSAFTDGHHMLRPGAEAFSDRLLREVILPFFRPRGPGPPPGR